MSLRRFVSTYKIFLQKRPYTTHAVQTVVLMSLGDTISQCIVRYKSQSHSELDTSRIMKFGSIGLLLGPILNKWYNTVDRINFGSKKIAFVKKVLLDQLCFAPLVIVFITVMVGIIDRNPKEMIQDRLCNDYFHILCANYKIWPLVQCVNFSIVPLNYRVLVTQSVAVGWNAYLSWKLNTEKEKFN